MFYDNFLALCHKKGVAPTNACRLMGLSSTNLANWRRGRVPHDSTLVKIADFLGVSVQDLLDDSASEAQTQSDPELDQLLESLKNDPQRRMMFHLLDGATADEVRAAVEIVDVLMRKLRR